VLARSTKSKSFVSPPGCGIQGSAELHFGKNNSTSLKLAAAPRCRSLASKAAASSKPPGALPSPALQGNLQARRPCPPR